PRGTDDDQFAFAQPAGHLFPPVVGQPGFHLDLARLAVARDPHVAGDRVVLARVGDHRLHRDRELGAAVAQVDVGAGAHARTQLDVGRDIDVHGDLVGTALT